MNSLPNIDGGVRWSRVALLALAFLAASNLPGQQGAAPKSRPSIPAGGRARVTFFGITEDGFKFVYVLDRSASMAGGPLHLAKSELKTSLEALGRTHQFQIVFYNERPKTFALAGTPGKAVFGTEQNKEQAFRHIDAIAADGGTDHEAALSAAFNLAPDVIFFLTDAAEPELSDERLAKISARNRSGAIIHAIEFGTQPHANANFLARLARQSGGQYRFFDTNKADKASR